MTFAMTEQQNGDFLIQVAAWLGMTVTQHSLRVRIPCALLVSFLIY